MLACCKLDLRGEGCSNIYAIMLLLLLLQKYNFQHMWVEGPIWTGTVFEKPFFPFPFFRHLFSPGSS